jgi:hypothetical protein
MSKGPRRRENYLLRLGIQGITSLREILDIVKDFEVAPEIKIDLKYGIEYYRVSLVGDFFHHTEELRFTYALVEAEMVSSEIPNNVRP